MPRDPPGTRRGSRGALRREACKLRPGEREGPAVGLEEATGGERLEKEKAPPQGVAGRASEALGEPRVCV